MWCVVCMCGSGMCICGVTHLCSLLFTLNAVEQKCKELDYVRLLNNVLPQEIRVLAWASVPDEFSARFDCTHRAYRFFFVRGNLNIEVCNW